VIVSKLHELAIAAVALSAVGCGRLHFDPLASGDGGGSDGGDGPCTLGPWGNVVHLDTLASPFDDWSPTLSKDALTMVFASNRGTSYDLYLTTRATPTSTFGAPQLLALSTTNGEGDPQWSADGSQLYYTWFDSMTMTGGVFVADYLGGTAFGTPQTPSFATPGFAYAFTPGDVEMFYTDSPAQSQYGLHRATRPTPASDWVADATIDFVDPTGTVAGWGTWDDGEQTLYFERTVGALPSEIATITRSGPGTTFGAASPVTTIGASNGDPEVSRDGRTLVFASDRPGGQGLSDLYVATRSCM